MSQEKSPFLNQEQVVAGSATVDISPLSPCFLHGYPGVARYSVGVHDPLECNALWLEAGGSATLMLANDVIYVGKALVARVRHRISELLPIPQQSILISATHTHSGTVLLELVSEFHDPIVPKPDQAYLQKVEDAMVRAAELAFQRRVPAEVAWELPRAPGIGTNRHDVNGPADLDVPTLAVRAKSTQKLIAVSIICTMHPTVLHEDSLLISGDFLGIARQQLREQIAPDLSVLIHVGACGNQSPRHVTKANTFAEAARLGQCLSQPVRQAIGKMSWKASAALAVDTDEVVLDVRPLPDVVSASDALTKAESHLAALRAEGAPRTSVRTAECDLFGAQTTHRLARTHADGMLVPAVQQSRVAEVMILRIGDHRLIAWPGEWFVEYQLDLRAKHPDCFLLTMANGELQGYVVTDEAIRERWYEAGNAVFDSKSTAARVLSVTEALLEKSK